jgi:hypothetical protein
VLAYSPAIQYWSVAEKKALVGLIKRGDLRVEEVTGKDLEPWTELAAKSLHPSGDSGYLVTPARAVAPSTPSLPPGTTRG